MNEGQGTMLRKDKGRVKPLWLWLLPVVLCCVTAHGQAKDEYVFASVPADLRASLVKRLKVLVEYQRTQQWEKQYDLLSITATQGDSREEYAKRNRRWYTEVVPDDLILDFIPKTTTAHESPADTRWWTIYGCARLRKKGRTVELYASVDAHREGGNWSFSPIGIITPVDGQAKPCPYSSTAARPSPCPSARGKKTWF